MTVADCRTGSHDWRDRKGNKIEASNRKIMTVRCSSCGVQRKRQKGGETIYSYPDAPLLSDPTPTFIPPTT